MTFISPQRIPSRKNREIAALFDKFFKIACRLRNPFAAGPSGNLRSLAQENISEILVFRPDGLGDLILSTPVFSALKKIFPGCRITLAVASWSVELARLIGSVDEIIAVDVPWFVGGGFPAWRGLLNSLKKMQKRKFSLAVELRGDFRNMILLLLAGVPLRAGFDITGCSDALTHVVPADENHHSTSLIEAMLRSMAPDLEFDMHTRLEIPDSFRAEGKEILQRSGIVAENERKKIVVIHPGARWKGRQWLPERYAEVADRLSDSGCAVIVTGSFSEKVFVDEVLQKMTTRPVNLAGKTTFKQFLGIIGLSDAFLGVDSGPMHIASAMGKATIALYGAATPEIVGPRGHKDMVISHCEKFDCSPCSQTCCIYPDNSCMHAVTVEEVWQALQNAISNI